MTVLLALLFRSHPLPDSDARRLPTGLSRASVILFSLVRIDVMFLSIKENVSRPAPGRCAAVLDRSTL